MITEIHFRVAGALLILLAAINTQFGKRFRWKEETAALSLLTRQVFYVHAFFIVLVVFLNGVLFVGWPHLLVQASPLRDVLLVGIGVFWILRLIVQLFVYEPRIWRGNSFRTAAHVVFTLFWLYLVWVCFGAVWRV